MRVIRPSVEILDKIDGQEVLKKIEMAGRVCYKSEGKATDESAEKFVAGLLKRGHESVVEHVSVTVRFIVDRGVSHEIVRHRIASYSQESTRYCNYANDQFSGEITVIKPLFFDENTEGYKHWWQACKYSEGKYFQLLDYGSSPQEARSVLPNSLKTEVCDDSRLARVAAFLAAENWTRCSPADERSGLHTVVDVQEQYASAV
jgi:thymidylate synthase (FAD)